MKYKRKLHPIRNYDFLFNSFCFAEDYQSTIGIDCNYWSIFGASVCSSFLISNYSKSGKKSIFISSYLINSDNFNNEI